jgi:hypothetical protein
MVSRISLGPDLKARLFAWLEETPERLLTGLNVVMHRCFFALKALLEGPGNAGGGVVNGGRVAVTLRGALRRF